MAGEARWNNAMRLILQTLVVQCKSYVTLSCQVQMKDRLVKRECAVIRTCPKT